MLPIQNNFYKLIYCKTDFNFFFFKFKSLYRETGLNKSVTNKKLIERIKVIIIYK